MRKRLLYQQDPTRRPRWLYLLFALLLLPLGSWAQTDYGITIGGVAVTSNNATNVMGDNGTPTVTFDSSTNTLTLNNAQVNGTITSSITNLNLHLVGSSVFTVNTEQEKATLFEYTGAEQSPTLTVSTDNIGASLSAHATSSNNKLNDVYWYSIEFSEGNSNYWVYTTGIDVNSLWYCHISKPYVWVAGEPIDDSNLDEYASGGNLNFNKDTNTLTFTEFQTDYAAYNLVKSNLANLNIVASGSNEIIMESPISNCMVFQYTGASGENSSLNLVLQDGATIKAKWNTGNSSTDYLINGFTESNISTDLDTATDGSPFAEAKNSAIIIANVTFYNLWVEGTQANSVNAEQIVSYNDGFVSFDGNNTVTLNNYSSQNNDSEIVPPFITNGIGNLTISLVGDNEIRGYSSFLAKSDAGGENYTATFTTTVNDAGKLILYDDVSTGHTVNYINGLGTSEGEDGDYVPYLEISLADYHLIVGNVPVNSGNAANILADDIVNNGKASFNLETNTLTLNGVNLSSEWESLSINSELDNLTINLTGTNTVDGGIYYDGSDNGTLSFTGSGSLAISNSDGVITGFASVDFGSFNLTSESSPGFKLNEQTHLPQSANGEDVVTQLTLTTTAVYPIWVLDHSDYSVAYYKQVTAENKANVLGDDFSSVSYNGNGTLTLKSASVADMNGSSFIIGETINALTVHLIGYNQIGGSGMYAFEFLDESTTLTFTTSESLPGEMVSYSIPYDDENLGVYGHMSNSTAISCQNGLALNDITIGVPSTTTFNVTRISGFVSVVNDEDDSDFMYTNNSSFRGSHAELSHENPLYVKVLSQGETTATASLWPSDLANPSLINKVTFQFDWGTCENTAVTVQVKDMKFAYNEQTELYSWQSDGINYSDAISLTTADADGIIEIPLTSTVTSEYIQLYFSSNQEFSIVPISVALTRVPSYNIEVDGVLVSQLNATNVLGDGKVSFNNETNTLTLNNASISVAEERPAIDYMGTANLTISLIGANTIESNGGCEAIRYNGYESHPTLTFAKGDAQPCSLTISTEEETVISSGFSQVNGVNDIGNATGNNLTLLSDGAATYDPESNGLCTPGQEENEYLPVLSVTIKDVYNISIAFGERHWATYAAPVNQEVPEELTAYIVTGVSDNEATVQQVEYLPQGIGVLLYKEEQGAGAEQYTTFAYEGQTTTFSANKLVATTAATAVSSLASASTSVYVLYNDNFVKATSGTIAAGRCYLPLATTVSAGSRLAISFDEAVTGIGSLTTLPSPKSKEGVYNLNGQRVTNPTKGLFIVNGKKVIIK
ncbi:MAG: hypothetical protein K6G08_06070 [Prevotella sp.]|nr:hypothetical protein [Prevotella sp.]